jgi:Membrane protein involved in the export of O-antigen and teichoic acid
VLSTVGEQATRLLVSIVIARFLLPSEYGLTAMLAIFIGLGELLINGGFSKAIIQRANLTDLELSSVFFFNIFVSMGCAAALTGLGPFIASFYHMPALTKIAAILSIDFIISALGLVQNALLIRNLEFKVQFAARMAGTICSGIVGVLMAIRGWGVWSLVAQALIANGVTVACYWVHRGWRPSNFFRAAALRPMFSFGSKLLFSGVLEVFFKNIYTIVIGKAFSAFDLGLYSRAQQFQQLPVENISSITERVLFSSFSRIQDDKEQLKRMLRQTLVLLSMVTFPLMVGLAICAKPLILLVLGSNWLGCAAYLRPLCVIGSLYPLQLINLTVLTAQGRSDLFLRLEIIKKIFALVVVALTWKFGIMVMIYGQILVAFICYAINSYYTGRFLNYGLFSQLIDILPYAGTAIVMGAVVYFCGNLAREANVGLFASQILVGIVAYLAACRLFSLQVFMDVWRRLPAMCGLQGRQTWSVE